MVEFPTYDALAAVDRHVIFGLLTRHGRAAAEASYETPERRDRALMDAVAHSLFAASSGIGTGAGSAVSATSAPRWLRGLARRELRAAAEEFWPSHWPAGRFFRVRLLERLGLVSLEPDDTYVLAMISALGPGQLARLKADPDLIDHALWRVFEVEGGGQISLANVDRYSRDEWRRTVLRLAADGTLDRGRVLSECLGALRRDFLPFRARWFSALFMALGPTMDELAALQLRLRSLLGVSDAATVGLAVKLLTQVHRAGRLEISATLEALPAAVLVKTKGTAIGAIRLARSAGTRLPLAVAEIARAALGHPHPDVQGAAAELLSDLGDFASVTAVAGEFTPSVRDGLGIAVEVVNPTPVVRQQRLAPVAVAVTTSDVAERTAALLEDSSDVGELEAVLAALTQPGFAELLAPLRKRAKAVAVRGPRTDMGDGWLPGQVARLVMSALHEPLPPAVPLLASMRFVSGRFAELGQSAGPLLATPDMPGGWVSPSALVARLAADSHPRHFDLAAALLRLHPEGRADVSNANLPAPVLFALTGQAPTDSAGMVVREGPEAWWVAAQRSRSPFGVNELPQLEADLRVSAWQENGKVRRSHYAFFEVTTAGTGVGPDDIPTELGGGTPRDLPVSRDSYLGDWVASLAAVWPHDAEHFLALTCWPVLQCPNWPSGSSDGSRVLHALAQHPGRLGSLAANTLAAALVAGNGSIRIHAVDSFVDLVLTNRMDTRLLEAPLTEHWEARPLIRLAECLRAISQVPGGSVAVVRLLTGLLPRLPANARGVNGLLQVLRDETLRYGWDLHDPRLRDWLSAHHGSSGASKTARLLLG